MEHYEVEDVRNRPKADLAALDLTLAKDDSVAYLRFRSPDKVPSGTESVQTNFISKIAATNKDEKQFSTERAGILWIDFLNFGSVSHFNDARLAEPLFFRSLWHAVRRFVASHVWREGRSSL